MNSRIFPQCIATLVMSIMALSPVVAQAQLSGVQFNLLESSDTFENSMSTLYNESGEAVGDFATDNGLGDDDFSTGDPLLDGAIAAVGGMASVGISCAISGFVGNLPATGAAEVSNVAAVPTSDAVTQRNTSQTQSNTKQLQTKECMMDGIAIAMKENLIRGIIRGLITYINNGFSGGPGYMQDRDALIANEQDQQFEAFVNNPNNFSSLCSAWESDVRLALATQYASAVSGTQVTQLSASGTGTGRQFYTGGIASCSLQSEGYLGADGEGEDYWSNFLAKTTTTGGNAVTSYMAVENELVDNIQDRIEARIEEVQRNGGFFDVTYCNDGSAGYADMPGVAVGSGSQDCKITTPGTVINHQLNNAIGSDIRRLELADEFDELINALVGQLLNMIFSEKGLEGTSQVQAGESESLVDEYYNSLDEEGVAENFQALITQLNNRDETIDDYVDSREEILAMLFNAREVVYDAYACYNLRYNTWMRTSTGEIIDPSQVDSVPSSDRERVAYSTEIDYGNGQVTTYLLPEQAGEHFSAYVELLDNIDNYVQDASIQIDSAEQSREEIAELRRLAQIMRDADPDDRIQAALANDTIVQLVAEEFGAGASSITVALDDSTYVQIPQNLTNRQLLQVFSIQYERLTIYNQSDINLQLDTVRGAVTDMIEGPQLANGTGRAPGVLSDINQCQAFTTTLDRESAVSSLEGEEAPE